MNDKYTLLNEVDLALKSGLIAAADLQALFTNEIAAAEVAPSAVQPVTPIKQANRLSAVDILFYVAGIVLYSALLSSITQSWDSGSTFVHIAMSAGIGMMLWSVAYFLIKSSIQSDIRRGLINALLLTGSLSIVTGGYIISNAITSGFGEVNYIAGSIMLAIVGGLHIGFDSLIKRDITLLMGVLLSVAAFPALMFGFLEAAEAGFDAVCTVLLISAGLLAFASRVVGKFNQERRIDTWFDPLATFIALGSIYAASFGEYGIIWLPILISGVIGLFFLSIMAQSKRLLGNASFFLVLTVITISFKYFSGFGITSSLIVATVGLLGTAAIASSINKKYFNETVEN